MDSDIDLRCYVQMFNSFEIWNIGSRLFEQVAAC